MRRFKVATPRWRPTRMNTMNGWNNGGQKTISRLTETFPPHWPLTQLKSNIFWKSYRNTGWTKTNQKNRPDHLSSTSRNGDRAHHQQNDHAALLLDYIKAAQLMTSNSDGTSKKDFRPTRLSPFDPFFLFQFLDLTSCWSKISVWLWLESAAIYHHDPNSVRTWPTLPWAPSTSSWTCTYGALLGQSKSHWKRSTSCTWSLLLRTSQNGTPGRRTSEHTPTWPSTLLFGAQHHSHAHWSSPRSGLQDYHYKRSLFTDTHTFYSIWCLWPHARTTWQLSSPTTPQVCLPSQQKCSSDGG